LPNTATHCNTLHYSDAYLEIQEEKPALHIEIPARKTHDGIVENVLVRQQEFGGSIEMEETPA